MQLFDQLRRPVSQIERLAVPGQPSLREQHDDVFLLYRAHNAKYRAAVGAVHTRWYAVHKPYKNAQRLYGPEMIAEHIGRPSRHQSKRGQDMVLARNVRTKHKGRALYALYPAPVNAKTVFYPVYYSQYQRRRVQQPGNRTPDFLLFFHVFYSCSSLQRRTKKLLKMGFVTQNL